jgi:hypothetical protein
VRLPLAYSLHPQPAWEPPDQVTGDDDREAIRELLQEHRTAPAAVDDSPGD